MSMQKPTTGNMIRSKALIGSFMLMLIFSSAVFSPPVFADLSVSDFTHIPGVSGFVIISAEPDGSSDRVLYEVDLSTGNGEVILDEGQFGGWKDLALSPDGSKLAFFDGQDFLNVLYTDTGLVERWVDAAGGSSTRYLAWSPTGGKLAFVNNGDLYVVNDGGDGLTLMIRHLRGYYNVATVDAVLLSDQVRRPVWSSDESMIFYDDFPVPSSTHGPNYISPENKAIYRLTSFRSKILSGHRIMEGSRDDAIFAFEYESTNPALKRIDYSGNIIEDFGVLQYSYPLDFTILSPDSNYLAYARYSSSFSIFNLDSRDKIAVSLPASHYDVAWSPDSKRIGVWCTNNSFNIVNPDTGDVEKAFGLGGLSETYGGYYYANIFWIPVDMEPAGPSPDPPPPPLLSGKIVFQVVGIEAGGEIATQNVDGSDLDVLTNTGENGWNSWPSASPLGDKIAFVAVSGETKQLWVMNRDGTNKTMASSPDLLIEAPPRWSPDGSKIAFLALEPGDDKYEDDRSLYVVNPDGTEQQLLTEDVNYDYGNSALNFDWMQYSWAPDSCRIAYGERDGKITVAYADGRPKTFYNTNFSGLVSDPVWSPDGQEIAFVCNGDYSDQIRVMDDGGGNERTILTDLPGAFDFRISNPQWSSDGSQIAFIIDFGSIYQYLYAIDSDGSNPRRLLHELDDTRFFWIPDTYWILCGKRTSYVCLIHANEIELVEVARGVEPAWLPSPLTQAIVELGPGLNIFSLPLNPANKSIQSVLSPIYGYCDSVWAYDASTKTWEFYVVGQPPSSNSLKNIEPGRGYCINMNSAATLRVVGAEISNTEIQLWPEWNLVGHNSLETRLLENALSSIDGLYSCLYVYDNTNRKWLRKFSPEGPTFLDNLNHLEAWNGIWIHAKESCSWNIELSNP